MSAAATTVRVMANFAIRLVHGPHWNPARPIRGQDAWDEHAAFMDGLARDGFIILGGPVGDGEQTLHADENEIRARLAQDPWSSAGLLQIGTNRALGVLARQPPSAVSTLTDATDLHVAARGTCTTRHVGAFLSLPTAMPGVIRLPVWDQLIARWRWERFVSIQDALRTRQVIAHTNGYPLSVLPAVVCGVTPNSTASARAL
jgi:hypothetical protein